MQDGEGLPGAEWVYMLGHGGGVVSGDVTRVKVSVGDSCTAALTTQSFTKVYHHHEGQVARQVKQSARMKGKSWQGSASASETSVGSTACERISHHYSPDMPPDYLPVRARSHAPCLSVVITLRGGSTQVLRAQVGDGALLLLLPDPVVPFRDSRFTQHQEFDLAPSAPTCVDGVEAGQSGAGSGEANAAASRHAAGGGGTGGSLVLVDWVTSGVSVSAYGCE